MIETKPSDVTETSGKMKDVAKQSGRLETDKGKKTIACCSFQRAPSAAATRKTVHVSKIKATTTTAKKKQKTKATKAKRRRANKRRGI